jgi:formylmethanofuran dehydrogenase subunit E
MSKDRLLLAELIRSWAQSHSKTYTVGATEEDDDLRLASSNFSWIIREMELNIDLVSLLNMLEVYVEDIRQRRKLDGMFCCKCQQFYDFAEANQEDGSMICYSCRHRP